MQNDEIKKNKIIKNWEKKQVNSTDLPLVTWDRDKKIRLPREWPSKKIEVKSTEWENTS
jgi:hypothetical protein